MPAAQAATLVRETMAGTAALLTDTDTLALRRAVTSPGGTTARGLDALEQRRRARRAGRRDGRGGGGVMEARQKIADFLSALIHVYTLIIFASIIVSWIFSFGVRVPYSRPLNAVLDFLRDVTNPYLRLFRRLGPAVRPDRLQPDRRDPRAADRRADPRRT